MNMQQYIKELISAKEVVKHFLGEPQKSSGNSSKWSSPFRDGDSDPSFSANDVCITDFGGDFKGDIFSFVAKYKNISVEDAVEFIVDEFNIDTSLIPTETQITKITKTTPKNKIYTLKVSVDKTDEIYAMFDDVKYSQKPKGDEIGIIKNRISSLEPLVYTLDDIKKAVTSGQTCIPAGIKGQNEWKDNENYLQIFMVDIDNVITVNDEKQKITADNEKHITVEKIVEYCKTIDLVPTFIYYTFSHTDQQHKFRLVYILKYATNQQKIVKGVYQFLVETFKDYNVDTSPTNIATLFLGGKSIAFESDAFYEIEEIEDSSNVELIDNLELKLVKDAIQYTDYVVGQGKIWKAKKETYFPISNFVVYVDEKLTYINGRETDTETYYRVKCILLDNPNVVLPKQIIDKENFLKFNFILGSAWDRYAIICAGPSNTDKLREIMQLISKDTMSEKKIYSHTGFIRIDNKLCYLYHGGVIGDVDNIDVDLTTDKFQQYCFTDKTFDIKDALQCSLSILDLASNEITIPLLATTYLSPFTSILSEENINADFIIYIQGKSRNT